MHSESFSHRLRQGFTGAVGLIMLLAGQAAGANGAVGEHVNHLQDHIDDYTKDVHWLIEQVDGIVTRYAQGGVQAAGPEAMVDHWEAVDFHAAIETNFIELYASIWQGLFGVRDGIEQNKPVAEVRAEQVKLEQALWQSLGAVRLAAKYQQRGLLPRVENTQAASPAETMDIIDRQLGRVVAKYAEQLPDEAVEIVHETYLTRFEGVEGMLIEQDAQLVEELEVYFNVTLPGAIKANATLDEVRNIVKSMNGRLERARKLLAQSRRQRKAVF